jgi:glycogen debranching enzyme
MHATAPGLETATPAASVEAATVGFALADLRVNRDSARALSFLEPMAHHQRTHGLGTGSEIFNGDTPFAPRGCIAQAWTVGDILRVWSLISAGTGE